MTGFVIAREWNRYGPQDYLIGWDAKWGTVCSARGSAMVFPTSEEAEAAAAKAKRLVPTFMNSNTEIEYRVLPA